MAEKDRFVKSENKRICFYITPEDKKSLELLAAKELCTVSEIVRRAVKKYMVIDSFTDNIDMIDGIIEQTIAIQLKKVQRELGKILDRLTVITAAGYFTNISAVAELLDRDRYSSFEKIEKLARRKALLYANTKSLDGLDCFLDDERIKKIECELVSKEYKPSDNYDDFNYTDFDF